MRADIDLHMTPLSGRVLNRNAKGGTTGTHYIRRSDAAKESKRLERLRILQVFGYQTFSGRLCILTFPSTNWTFEGMLLNNRSRGRFRTEPVGGHTAIVGIEREDAIYRVALNLIPTVKTGFRSKQTPPYATSSVRTFAIKRYLRASFEDMAFSQVGIDNKEFKFNGAWLDFNGPLTLHRRDAIEAFLENHTAGYCRLVLTVMDARYDKATMAVWGNDRLQSIPSWLRSKGATVHSAVRYKSSVPMLEFVASFYCGNAGAKTT